MNLSSALQLRFNEKLQSPMGRPLAKMLQDQRDTLYERLTPDQKNEARKLLQDYEKKYFIKPSELDLNCRAIYSEIMISNVEKTFR